MTRLAEALAVGRASLYRVLAALEAEGVILRRGREIEYLKNKEVLP